MSMFREAMNMSSLPGLTSAQRERLALLTEELGESLQAIGKIERHGYDSEHPVTGIGNTLALERELGHVLHAIKRLCLARDLNPATIRAEERLKRKSVEPYLHHCTYTAADFDRLLVSDAEIEAVFRAVPQDAPAEVHTRFAQELLRRHGW